MEKIYGNHSYGNPRGRAARAPCIDFLEAKYTVSILDSTSLGDNKQSCLHSTGPKKYHFWKGTVEKRPDLTSHMSHTDAEDRVSL
jgi:hypothetical protein